MPAKAVPLVERFWPKVEKPSGDGCWVWTGCRVKKGYGIVRLDRSERMASVHRVSWALHNGPIPDGLLVLHRCDNPPCVNPDHLFLGTHTDNMKDMVRKGRQSKKLTPDQARTVYRRALAGEPHASIAKDFGIRREAVSAIKRGLAWSRTVTEGGI